MVSAAVAFYVVLFTWNLSDSNHPEPAEWHGEENAHISTFLLCLIKLKNLCWHCSALTKHLAFWCLCVSTVCLQMTRCRTSPGPHLVALMTGSTREKTQNWLWHHSCFDPNVFIFWTTWLYMPLVSDLASVMSPFITDLSLDCIWRAHYTSSGINTVQLQE